VCEDEILLKGIAEHQRVLPWIGDDSSTRFELDPNQLYLSIGDKGFVSIQKMNWICFQVHIALMPDLWGQSVEVGAAVKEWIFTHTKCRKIVAIVPADNALALRLAKKCGMKEEGRITKSFSRGYVLIDQIVFGISRGS
jgi:RimJ/RimL family protein N-acetyltransferase